MKFYKKLEKHLEEVLKIKTTPHEIAIGFALGALIAILPTFGLGIFIGLGLVLIFNRISKISMMVAFAVFNPVVLIFTYAASISIGKILFSSHPLITLGPQYLNQISSFAMIFLFGNFILAGSIFLISYAVVFYLSKWYQKTHPIGKIEEFIKEEVAVIKEDLGLNNSNS